MFIPHSPSQYSSQIVPRARGDSATLPPGATIDYVNGPSKGLEIIVSSAVTIAAAFLLVFTRVLVKLFVKRSPGWDDYTSVVALGFAIARVVGNVVLVKNYGVGHHFTRQWYQIDNVLYLFGVLFAKVSILLLYLRLFKVKRLFRNLDFALMALVFGYCVSLILAILFACQPISRTWNSSIRGTCPVHIEVVDYTIGAFNIVTDTAILILPIPLICRLQVSKPRLVGLLLTFGTGAFVVATSIIREVIMVRTLKDKDQTWSMVDDIVWLTVEVNIGIFCGSLPVLPPLFRHVLTKDLLMSRYHSFVNLLRSSVPTERSGDTGKTSWTSKASRSREEYLELQEGAKVTAAATSRAVHEGF